MTPAEQEIAGIGRRLVWHPRCRERSMSLSPTVLPPSRYHFSGIAGAGMNPLAQLMKARLADAASRRGRIRYTSYLTIENGHREVLRHADLG